MMGGLFSAEVRDVARVAQNAARRLGHRWIGAEHLRGSVDVHNLGVAVVSTEGSNVPAILKALEVSPASLRTEIENRYRNA